MPPIAIDVPTFASTQLALLARELAAELAETSSLGAAASPAALQRAGRAVLNLVVGSQRTGLGGKTVVELVRDPALGTVGLDEAHHGVRVGDLVAVHERVGAAARKKDKAESESRGVKGVVVRCAAKGIAVALDGDGVEVPGERLWLLKLANDVTYKRMNQTMTRLQKQADAEHSPLVQVLFGRSSPTPASSVPPPAAALGGASHAQDAPKWISTSLNDAQRDAVRFALAAREIALIHGPPGTGKTHTLVEVILQLAASGARVLVCGPSNISVDNLVERLAPHRVAMVRLGHPARLLPSVLSHALDVLTRTSDAGALVQDVRREMDERQAGVRKARGGRERRALYEELRELRREYRERERACVEGLVRQSRVVLATLHGAGGQQLRHAEFDVVVIDEASQALEAQCWVPLLAAKKAILAGDHLQLPPTIKSLNAKSRLEDKQGSSRGDEAGLPAGATLERTLFDRLLDLHGTSIKRMLTTQYRMHERIMAFPSAELYESQLIADEAVKHRLLTGLTYEVQDTEDTREALIFYDTQGGDFPEKAESEDEVKSLLSGESKSNEMEAALVRQHVGKLVAAGVRCEDIAVITPYNAQLGLLAGLLREEFPGVDKGSVDGFQGREAEAVIVSLVRSNDAGEVGFLGEKRRLNVAMTRPKRQLCVIGDSETVGKGSKFLKRWMEHLEHEADLRYPDPSTLL